MMEYSRRKCVVGTKSEEAKRESKKMSLTVGIFFDGTGNNKYNVNFWEQGRSIRPSDTENYRKYKVISGSRSSSYDSYKQNTRTNIAKLWYLYDTNRMPNSIKVYVEGPGTSRPSDKLKKGTRYNDEEGKVSSGSKDNTWGSAFAYGATGINAKIEIGCKLAAEQVKNKIKEKAKVPNELFLTFDVFGFSRGAAAARSFVSRMFFGKVKNDRTDGRNVCFEKYLSLYGIKTMCPKIHMHVRFLGIFDTVSSYHYSSSFFPDFSNDVQELALKIPYYVRRTVHLAAADEYRRYFSLTNISSAENRGKEIILPGAHSDIGGGYLPTEKEEIMMSGSTYGPRQCRGYLSFKELHDEKWISEAFYKKWETWWDRLGHLSDIVRNVKYDYAKIPLYIMGQHVRRESIRIKEDVFATSSSIAGKNVSPKLRELKKLLLSKQLYCLKDGEIQFTGTPTDKQLMLAVRTDYIHLSARNDFGHDATGNNKRIIYNG